MSPRQHLIGASPRPVSAPIRRVVVILAVALVAGVVLIPHVVQGDFTADDWFLASTVRFSGLGAGIHEYLTIDHRPLLAVYLPLLQWVFGENARAELAWVACMHLVLCLSLYWFLRTLGLERRHATLISALVFLFPFSDASWMYVIGGVGTVAVTMWLLGSVAALKGLKAPGRLGWRLHALAVGLYVASVLTYELAVVLILFSVVLYAGRASWPAILKRWAVDLGAMVPVLLVETRAIPAVGSQEAHPILGASAQLTHARSLVAGAGRVIRSSLVPFGRPNEVLVLGLALAIGAASLLAWRLLPARDPARSELRRWLLVALAALGGVVAAWLVLLPANSFFYEPDFPGVTNRINLFAGVWLCLLAYAAAMLLGTLLARGLRLGGGWSHVPALLLVAALLAGYAQRIDADESHWAAAASIQQQELAAVHRAAPRVPPGGQLLLSGARFFAAPGVVIFGSGLDLSSAIRLRLGTPLAAVPVSHASVKCGARAVLPTVGFNSSVPYRSAFVLDLASGHLSAIHTRGQCLHVLRPGIAPTALTSRQS